MKMLKAIGIVSIAAILAGCGGGGGGTLPTTSSVSNPGPQAQGKVTISITIPAAKKQQARTAAYLRSQQRRAQYLSGAITQVDFTLNSVNGVATSGAQYNFTIYVGNNGQCQANSGGGFTCTTTEVAPAGSDYYIIKGSQCSVSGSSPSASCASLGGTLTELSSAHDLVNVALDQTVAAAFTFSGVVASLAWSTVSYAYTSGPTAMLSSLWFSQPYGANSPSYNTTANSYTCASVGTCYEPAAMGTAIAYGVVLEARDPSGAVIIGAPPGGSVYQTPVYTDANGHVITIQWGCQSNTGHSGTSLQLETGGGPYTSSVPIANNSFNSPVANPASDPDGGNTVDGLGNQVTAVGNNGVEINWDGVSDLSGGTFSCAAYANGVGVSTSAPFYVGNGSGGINVTPGSPLDSTMYLAWGAVKGSPYIPANVEAFGPTVTHGAGSATYSIPANEFPALTLDKSGNIWTSGFGPGGADIVEFTPGTSTPARTITSNANASITGHSWRMIAVDSLDNVYLEDTTAAHPEGVIDVYPGTANGETAPTQSYTLPSSWTNLESFTIDSSDNLWVAYMIGNQPDSIGKLYLVKYPQGSTTPTTVLSPQWNINCNGTATNPMLDKIKIDTNGNLIAFDGTSIEVFPAGFSDSTCPTRFSTQLPVLNVAVDDQGLIYTIENDGNVYIYKETATNGPSGYAQPFYSIVSPLSGQAGYPSGQQPGGLALLYPHGGLSGNAHRADYFIRR